MSSWLSVTAQLHRTQSSRLAGGKGRLNSLQTPALSRTAAELRADFMLEGVGVLSRPLKGADFGTQQLS